MICYRDMTFCTGDGCAKFDTCHRAMTPAVLEGARACGLGISQWGDPRKADCYEPKPNENENENENEDQ